VEMPCSKDLTKKPLDLVGSVKPQTYICTMKEKKLVKVSTYAIKNNISTTWVYKLIEDGRLKCVEHDKVKFIEIEK